MALVLKKKCDWPSFFFLFLLLGGCHTYRYIYDFYGWKVDGSISLMMMLCKLTYFTFYYCDGRIKDLPPILDFYSYIFFFPTAFMGPVFSFNTFDEFINLKGKYAEKYTTYKAGFV